MTGQLTLQPRFTLTILFSVLAVIALDAQLENAAGLRDRVRARFDVVALQGGVGLVPRQRDAALRIIEVRNGSVAINGEEVTGRQLRERLGADADLILRISYLDPAEQRLLTVPAGAAPPAANVPEPGADALPPAPPSAPPPVPPSAPLPAPSGTGDTRDDTGDRRGRRGGDMVRIMDSVNVPQGERVAGDVVAVMGSAQIDGEVDGDVTVVMGNATLGPASVVTGDVNVVGGSLNRAEGARVEGAIHNVSTAGRTWSGPGMPDLVRNSFFGRVGSLAGTLLRIALLGLFALILMAMGRPHVERIGDRLAADPLRAGLIGFAAQILFFPVLIITVVVLAISIIGIPLLLMVPFVIVLALIVLVVGFTGVAYHVGRMLNDRFAWTGRGEYVTVIQGVLAIAAFTLLARSVALVAGGLLGWPLSAVGYFVEYVAWTLGFGAAILTFPWPRRTPPPIPA